MIVRNKHISFCTWNINGIQSRIIGDKTNCIDFLDIINNHDFIVLTETWKPSIPNIEGYSCISLKELSKTNKRFSGGISLLFKECYKNMVEFVKSSNNFLWCKISKRLLHLQNDLFVCGVYIPPEGSKYFNDDTFDNLETDIEYFSSKGNVILLGDFNARTGKDKGVVSKDGNTFIQNDCSELSLDPSSRNAFDYKLNAHGKKLLDICKLFDLKILNGRTSGDSLGKVTYHGKNGVSTVDYVITDQNLFRRVQYFVIDKPVFLSDHSPISTWLQMPVLSTTDETDPVRHNLNSLESLPPQFIWTADSIEPYKKALLSHEVQTLIYEFLDKDFDTSNQNEINASVDLVEAIFMKAASLSLKLKRHKRGKKRKNKICNKKWFDYECKKARKELREFSNQKHSNPKDPFLRNMYHHKLCNFKKLLKTKKHNFRCEKLNELEKNSENSNFWKILKSANDEIQEIKIPPISEQQWINHFNTLHSKREANRDQLLIVDNLTSLESSLDSRENFDLNIQISDKEIKSCVKRLKNKKAASSDKIRNEMIRHSIDVMCPVFKKLFNIILESGIFPDSWCISSLTPIFKSGDTSDTNNYRGICVSSCLGKFFTSILNQRLMKFIQKNKILHNSQIGFLPNHRTSDHIFTMRCVIDRYVKNSKGGRIYACFIDFKKAFDSIWHQGLFFRLLQNNINGNLYSLIKNLYSKSSCFIKLGSKRTKTFQYERGVRQGCILSPLLFNLYLNELSILLDESSPDDCIILPNGSKLTSLLYADDLVLLSRSREGLQKYINTVSLFCSKWQMNINEKKSKVMVFCKKTSKKLKQESIFSLNNKNLEVVQDYTYLGVKMNSTGNFTAHQSLSREKALHAFFNVSRIVDFKKLKPHQASKLFDSLISPILTYGSEVWGVYEKQDFEKWDKTPIEKAHLRFCKYYLGVNSKASNLACRSELGRFPLKVFIDKLILKYFNHIMNLPENSIAKQCFKVSESLFERRKICYHLQLYQMLTAYNIPNVNSLEYLKGKFSHKNYHKSMKDKYCDLWNSKLKESRKLTFFRCFKEKFEVEKYLDLLKNFDLRRQFTKFRVSNHKLAIEMGRYSKQKTPAELRLCVFCNHNAVETEEHMFLHCPFYSTLRSDFFQKIKSDDSFTNKEPQKMIYNLISSKNESEIFYTSKFISKCFEMRNAVKDV